MKMMAKKPADRYPSMNDVAHALRRWTADHSPGSASGGPGSASGSNLAGSGRVTGKTPPIARRLTQAGMPSKRRDSGELLRAVADSPLAGSELTDTVADYDRSTTPPPSVARRDPDRQGQTDPKLREKLLKAAPLDTSLPPAGSNGESPVSLEDVLGSDALAAQPSAVGRSPGTSQRKAKKAPSKWIWIGIGAATFVGLILLIIVICMPPHTASRPKPSGESEAKTSAAATAADSGADRPSPGK